MKTVIVTGGSRGLGLEIVRRLAADGFRVVAVSRQRSADLDALLKEHGEDERVVFEAFDLAAIDEIHAFAARLAKRHGPPFALVNNAGIGSDGVLATMHNRDVEQVVTVNLLGPMVLTKYVCRSMLTRGEGRIINVSSIIARTGYSGLSVYAATKAGIEGFTFSLARELGRKGITVNCVAPGYVETDITSGLQGEKLASIRRRSALRELVTPRDVAGAVSYLLGPDAAMVTGTVLTVDAGSTA